MGNKDLGLGGRVLSETQGTFWSRGRGASKAWRRPEMGKGGCEQREGKRNGGGIMEWDPGRRGRMGCCGEL